VLGTAATHELADDGAEGTVLVTGWSTRAVSLPRPRTTATNVYVLEPCENVTVSFLSLPCVSFQAQCRLAATSASLTLDLVTATLTVPAFLMRYACVSGVLLAATGSGAAGAAAWTSVAAVSCPTGF
jgi:hypothetical protein